MTGFDPDRRLDRHTAGVQANRFVLGCCVRLMPVQFEINKSMRCEATREMQVKLAIGPRESDCGVWQASHCQPGSRGGMATRTMRQLEDDRDGRR